MTREEAIEQLENLRCHCEDLENTRSQIFGKKDAEAISAAIKALEKEPNKDLITLSKALITIVNEEGTEYGFTKACEIAERVLGLEKDAYVFYDPREE